MPRRIAIVTIGTLGDVVPYLALATEMQRRGHSVVFGTNPDFEQIITAHGVEFRSLGTSIQHWLHQMHFEKAMSTNLLVHFPALLREGQALIEDAARRAWAMAQGADAVVAHINTSFAIDIAEALDVPLIMTALQPLSPTNEFPICAYDWPDLGPTLNRLSYLVLGVQQAYYNLPRNQLRRELMGLGARKAGGLLRDSAGRALPVLYNFSSRVAPRPHDWPASALITGYWRLADRSGWRPSPELLRFLAAGPAPVYIGFGSMPFGAERNTRMLKDAIALWGGRAIVAAGWGGIASTGLPDTIFPIDEAPHDKLFPLVSAVVHHGGAGTTAASLYAGKPTFVLPQAYDQRFWGMRIDALGCGPRPIPLRALTVERLAAGLADISANTAYANRAKVIARELAQEDGLSIAANHIEAALTRSGRAPANEPADKAPASPRYAGGSAVAADASLEARGLETGGATLLD